MYKVAGGCIRRFLRLDHGLVYLADGCAHLLDVGDNLGRPAIEAKDRIIQGLEPNLLAVFADALVFDRLRLASLQLGPEFAVGRSCSLRRLDEHAVMLA